MRSFADLLRLPGRAFRHFFLDRSYARYYTPARWEREYREGYDLDTQAEGVRYGALASLVARYQGSGPVLDVGCGEGILEARLRATTAVPIVGVDYSETAIRKARDRGLAGCEFHCRDFRTFEPEGRFSLVLFNESLYYADDGPATLSKFSRYLVPGGVIVVSMFRTLVTRRMWRKLTGARRTLRHVAVRDATAGIEWDIRVFAGPPEASGP